MHLDDEMIYAIVTGLAAFIARLWTRVSASEKQCRMQLADLWEKVLVMCDRRSHDEDIRHPDRRRPKDPK